MTSSTLTRLSYSVILHSRTIVLTRHFERKSYNPNSCPLVSCPSLPPRWRVDIGECFCPSAENSDEASVVVTYLSDELWHNYDIVGQILTIISLLFCNFRITNYQSLCIST